MPLLTAEVIFHTLSLQLINAFLDASQKPTFFAEDLLSQRQTGRIVGVNRADALPQDAVNLFLFVEPNGQANVVAKVELFDLGAHNDHDAHWDPWPPARACSAGLGFRKPQFL